MAQLAKYLRIHRDSDNTDYAANLYSTVDEAGSSKFQVWVDEVGQAYAAVSGANPLPLKIQDAAGNTHTVHEMSKPPYSTTKYANPGTYTFTVPSGVSRIKVQMCAGGGGACAGYDGGTRNGASGGNSTISTNVCTGGGGGRISVSFEYIAESFEFVFSATGGAGGTPNGRGGVITFGNHGSHSTGGAGFVINGATYGSGGNTYHHAGFSAGGGSGGYISNTIDVTPLTTLSVVVGAGGSGAGQIVWEVGGPGISGVVFLEYGGDI